MARRQLANRAIGRQRRGHTDERKVMMNRFVVNIAADVRMLEQRHEFRAEYQLSIDLRIKQRLLAYAIARQEERLVALVPNGQGKHAAQVFWTISSILVV